MDQELSVLISSLQINAELTCNMIQYILRVESVQHPQLCPYISRPLTVQSRLSTASLNFHIPQYIDLAECYLFLDFQLYQFMEDRVKPVFQFRVQIQQQGDFLLEKTEILIDGRTTLTSPTERLRNNCRIFLIPVISCVPHALQLLFGRIDLEVAYVLIELKNYAIEVPIVSKESVASVCFLESEMTQKTGESRAFEVFGISSFLGHELPVFNCLVELNCARFTISGSSILLKIALNRLRIGKHLLRAIDSAAYIVSEETYERTEVKIRDIANDTQIILKGIKALWHDEVPELPLWQKEEVKTPGIEETISKIFKILQKRKNITEDYLSFDYNRNVSQSSIVLMIALVVYKNSPVLTANLQFLTDFQDIDNYGARTIILPLAKRSRFFGLSNASAEAICQPELTEINADYGKTGNLVELKNPDALAALLVELPTASDFLHFSGMHLLSDLPELYAAAAEEGCSETYRIHYVPEVIREILLKPATLTISLPAEYDSILVRENKLHARSLSVDQNVESSFFTCFLPFKEVYGQLLATECTVKPLCSPEKIDKHLFDIGEIVDEHFLVIYQLAGIELNLCGQITTEQDSFSVEAGIETGEILQNPNACSGVLLHNLPAVDMEFSSAISSTNGVKLWKKRIRQNMVRMRDEILFKQGVDAFLLEYSVYYDSLIESPEKEYCGRLKAQALEQFSELKH